MKRTNKASSGPHSGRLHGSMIVGQCGAWRQRVWYIGTDHWAGWLCLWKRNDRSVSTTNK